MWTFQVKMCAVARACFSVHNGQYLGYGRVRVFAVLSLQGIMRMCSPSS